MALAARRGLGKPGHKALRPRQEQQRALRGRLIRSLSFRQIPHAMVDRRSAHNAFQRRYFDTVDRARLHLGDTPYVRAHIDRLSADAGLQPGQRILEIGAGTGKFTVPLLARGLDIVGNDLSPVLLEKFAAAGGQKSICCDVLDLPGQVGAERFDRIIGFFVLHHLIEFDRVFEALAKVARPGGVIAFCEPVAWNPLYYLQILLTPSMRFRGEPSLAAMRPRVILPALQRAGFGDVRADRYGYFPPVLKNRAWGSHLEEWLESRAWVPFPHAFQVFSARLPS